MKKAIAMLLVIAMTAALAIGGTLAYLTDTDEDVNVMTLGQVKIDQLEYERVDVETENEDADVQEFHDNKPLIPAVTDKNFDYTPGDSYVNWDQIGKDGYTSDIWDPTKINNEVDKMVFVKNKGDWDAYVRTVFGFEANGFTEAQFKELFHLNLNDTDWTWEWNGIQNINGTNYFIVTATYNDILAPGAITPISLSQIALDSKATNDDVAGFGDTFQILVQSQAVQAAGFDDPETALNEAFGDIPNEDGDYPFEDDAPTVGTDIRTALHYLDGDGSTLITNKINSITFGKTEKYAAQVAGYDGTLVDVEQDVPVYAYYVPNGSNYDVYFLASDVIYAPTNCYELMYDGATRTSMSSLTSFNTENLDTGRTTSMARMFRDVALTSLDLTGFDTSAVTDMSYMFYNCNKLHTLDVTGWDTGNVTTTRCMFYFDNKLVNLIGEEGWVLNNVETVQSMFRACTALETVDVTNWDLSKVTTFSGFFCSNSDNTGAMALKELVGMENWNIQLLETLDSAFYGCGQLETMDMSGWNVSNLTSANHAFTDCYKLKNVDFSGWNTPALTTLDAIFNDCHSLVEVDVSDLDTGNVVTFAQIFEACWSLERVIGLENWDTSKGNDFSEMFSGCGNLEEVNLSTFDTRNANVNPSGNWVFLRFLSGCNKLEKITFGANFDFDGVGCSDEYRFVMPSASGVEGWDGNWYNATTGEAVAPADIPEKTAATYVAVKP